METVVRVAAAALVGRFLFPFLFVVLGMATYVVTGAWAYLTGGVFEGSWPAALLVGLVGSGVLTVLAGWALAPGPRNPVQ